MLSNYFTFFHSARLLNKRFAGCVIAEVYSQEKNALNILLYTPEPYTVTVSCVGRQNFIIARADDHRARINSVDLFPSLINSKIVSAYMDISDRIVCLTLSNGTILLFEMFGGKANVVLCESDGTIIDAFLNKKDLLGKQRTIQQSAQENSVDNFVTDKNSFISALQASSEKSIVVALKKLIPKLGSTLVTEILFRSHIATDVKQQNLSVTECTAIYNCAVDIITEALQQAEAIRPLIYFEGRVPAVFSIIPLRHCSQYIEEMYDDLFVGIQKFLSFGKSSSTFNEQKNGITSWLRNEIEKTERTVRAIESELAESSRGEQYELNAKLLLSHLHTISKGMKSVELENSFADNETVTIVLDPSLPPAQNAERYFEKAKRSKTARKESAERFTILQQRRDALKEFQEKLESVSDNLPDLPGKEGISLKNFLHLQNDTLHQLGYMTKKEEEELPPFKIFTVDGGFTVYAGKSSENNDLLTIKYAKPNDLWFHARGSSGSHVVLKIGSAEGSPSKKAIEQAASIAAYYSKMKNAKHVPIAMTEKKYVRKPKGVNPGTVVIEREKVIFVMPALPEQGK